MRYFLRQVKMVCVIVLCYLKETRDDMGYLGGRWYLIVTLRNMRTIHSIMYCTFPDVPKNILRKNSNEVYFCSLQIN